MLAWNNLKRKALGEFSREERRAFESIVSIKIFTYKLVGFGHKKVEMMHDFTIGSIGSIKTSFPKLMERNWSLDSDPSGAVVLMIHDATGLTCVLKKSEEGIWQGNWLEYDQMPVELSPELPLLSESDCKHYQYLQEEAIASIPAYPASRFKGRGIVIPGGGKKYFPCAWVCINILRNIHNCDLPIELWYLGDEEMDESMIGWMEELQVECINAFDLLESYPVRRLKGWELKPYAIIHSRFEEVIFIDADNVPLINPVSLFNQKPYQQTGAIFWPDFGTLGPERAIWKLCDVAYRDEPEFETGQMVLNKKKVWRALQLTMHYNEHSEFYYRYVNGDKDTFHMAWRKLNLAYSMPAFPLFPLTDTMCQHDFEGNIIFQHRNMDKWNLTGNNKRIGGFVHEAACIGFLEELRRKRQKRIKKSAVVTDKATFSEREELVNTQMYTYVRVGYDKRILEFLPDNTIGQGSASCEIKWYLRKDHQKIQLIIEGKQGITCILEKGNNNIWEGQWVAFEKMPVQLKPLS